MGSAKKLVLGVTMILLGWVFAQPAGAVTFRLTDLGSLGSSVSYAEGINASGHVVGYSFTALNQDAHPFLYAGGVMIDLGNTFGGVTIANGINNSDQIVGTGNASLDAHGFIYQNGTFTDLKPLGVLKASAVSSSGKVIGSSFNHAVIYSSGTVTDLGTLGGPYSTGYGINDAGQAVGEARTGGVDGFGSAVSHAFLYTNGATVDLGGLGGTYCSAGGINSNGTIIIGTGWIDFYQPGGLNRKHAFLYTNGLMHDLGTFGGNNSGTGNAPNSSGEFVGWAEVSGGASHAFLYTSGVMKDLNGLVDGSAAGWSLSVASGINDNSWI